MQFTELKLAGPIQECLAQKGFTEPTPIQKETIPLALNNRDLIACAKTGSGKTLAYLLPILQYIHSKPAGIENSDPVALVLAPTRELVVQIAEEAQFFTEAVNLRLATIYGGVDHDKQRRELSAKPQLVVATPGRLLDFIRGGEINLKSVVRIVLDEADRMLDMGFIADVQKILSKCSSNENEERQFSLFSATINYSALYSVWDFMREPEEILINPELIDHASIGQEMLHLGQDEKLPYLIQFLEANKLEPVIIFTNSRQYVDVLVKNLNHHSIASEGLSSMVTQNRRLRVLEDFKENKFRILVATDVASRGLHIEDVQLVINYDIPQDSETYVHRIGRTARAGKTGKALSFSSEFDYDSLEKLERYLKYKIPVMQPEQRFIDNLSFVRIVSVARQDGADHLRTRAPQRRDIKRRDQSRVSAKQQKHPLAAEKRNHGQTGEKKNSHNRYNTERNAHKNQRRDGAYFDARKKPQQNTEKNFAILSRDGKKSGVWAKVLDAVKSIFGRKKKPQLSERTKQILEQESRVSGQQKHSRKRPNNYRRRQGTNSKRRNNRGNKGQHRP